MAPAIPSVYKAGNTLSTDAIAKSYQWYNNGTPILSATANTYVANTPGQYSVTVTNAFGCSTSSTIVIANVGVQNKEQLASLKVYPNPANDIITINANSAIEKEVTIQIFDMNGKLLFNEKLLLSKGEISKTIKIDDWSKGIYLLQLHTNDGNTTQQKIVKK